MTNSDHNFFARGLLRFSWPFRLVGNKHLDTLPYYWYETSTVASHYLLQKKKKKKSLENSPFDFIADPWDILGGLPRSTVVRKHKKTLKKSGVQGITVSKLVQNFTLTIHAPINIWSSLVLCLFYIRVEYHFQLFDQLCIFK